MDTNLSSAVVGGELLLELGFIILISTILGLFAAYLKQPMIPVYILVGLLMNYISSMFGIFDGSSIKELSELGIAFLLFLVGMEFDLERIREIFPLAVVGTLMQITLSAAFLLGILTAFQLPFYTALLVAVTLSFSSTAIVVKFLSDKGLLDTIHGRNALGMLLMQDIVVVLSIPFLTPATSSQEISMMYHILDVTLKGAGLLALALMTNKLMIRPLIKKLYNNVDVTFLLSLSIMFIFSIISVVFGFSIAIGGFVGGLAMAAYPYSYRVLSRISHLRDFFIVLFFVALGLQISITSITLKEFIMAAVIIWFTLTVKPFIYVFISILFGNDSKNSLQLGLNMTQISEFSLILSSLALNYGLITQTLFSTIALVFFVTAFISAYLLQWSNILSSKFYKYFEFLEKISFNREELKEKGDLSKARGIHRNHIIIYGINAFTKLIIDKIDKEKVVVFDDNLTQVRILKKQGYYAIFGNPSDEEMLRYIHVDKASIFIYLKDNFEELTEVMTTIKSMNRTIRFIGRTKTFREALKLYEIGMDYVIIDGMKGYEEIVRVLLHILNHEIEVFEEIKRKEIKFLTEKAEKEILALHLPRDLQHIKEMIDR